MTSDPRLVWIESTLSDEEVEARWDANDREADEEALLDEWQES